MKKIKSLFFILSITHLLFAQNWPDVTVESKPGTRWWWLGSGVDSVNLTYNIQQYAKAGLGTLEITPIYGVQNNDANELNFLSPQWMEMLKHTQSEAIRNRMLIDMNTGTGWPFGGQEVTINDAATKAIFQEYKQIKGGQGISLDIRLNDKKQKDVAILSRIMAYDSNGKCLNLTDYADRETLKWNVPVGEWHIIVLYVGKTFQKVKRAAPGGEGYVMNHFDKDAVKNYLSKFDRAFKENSVLTPHAFFNDSYEVYQADWTPDFLEEFETRRGYKLEEYFPEFLDDTRPEKTIRIISDYRETISELLIENFTRQWTKWANRHGSITRNQAHGSPSNLIDTYASVDIPECEGFGLSQFNIKGLRQDSLTRKNDSDISMLKYASSAAHITGKPYVSSETFTWLTEHFRTSLAQCKPDMDLMFLSGVNRMFFHGTPYSPKDAEWPGWLFYATINMSPTNSIWRDSPAFFQYITRCQSFLQMGQPDNDFLVYLPIYDLWSEQPGRLLLFDIHKMEKRAPKFIETIHQIKNNGYDVDYISDKYILSTRVENNNLVTEGGSNYKAIIIPGVNYMPADVLAHLVSLLKEGATLIFTDNYPKDVPGFGQLEDKRKVFLKAKKEIPAIDNFDTTGVKHTLSVYNTGADIGSVITGKDYGSIFENVIFASPEELNTRFGLNYIRRKNDTGHHYFISCLKEKDVDDWITLSVDAQSVMLFDPVSGEKGLAQICKQDKKLKVRLQLKSGESIILQTFNYQLKEQPWNYIIEQSNILKLDHGWNLKFIESFPEINGTFNIDTPSSWTGLNQPNAKVNMGTGLYSITINIPAIKSDDWILDLGDVRESARIRVNGKDAGIAWSVPYRVKVGKYLQKGNNLIEIEVTNLPANRISKMDRNDIPWRQFKEINMVDLNYKKTTYKDWQPLPSGLNGNVKLIPVDYINN